MNQAELLWGVLSILPLGILVMLCTRCRLSRSRTIIREETRKKGQSVHMNEDKKRFEVVRSYTVSRTERVPRLEPELEHEAASNNANPVICQDAVVAPDYGNIIIANKHDLDQNYINPLAAEYYCCPQEFLKPPDDDDSNSYENVQIGKTESRTSVESGGSYENCDYAIKWKDLEKPEEKTVEDNDDDDDDDEDPDYVNTVPCPSL
ncbi:linker for activation of T-cells family member 2-like isoform X1 [Heptranchias perlo]|uniref:linker for activation of T-cells family member 2-like isoform X1 n=1 Tax=Heptranchias perlo TaxID=212740 RepID=UPI00355972BF